MTSQEEPTIKAAHISGRYALGTALIAAAVAIYVCNKEEKPQPIQLLEQRVILIDSTTWERPQPRASANTIVIPNLPRLSRSQ